MSAHLEPDRRSRTSIVLGDFTLTHTARDRQPADVTAASVTWLPAIVPGGVHESLLRAGVIEDPYVGRNEESVRWIEECDWWFRTRFNAPTGLASDERLMLICHGLDTVVRIWLNGTPVGSHENMFRPAEFDITDQVAASNELLLRFSPPLAGLTDSPVAVEQLARINALLGEVGDHGDNGTSAPSPMYASAVLRRKAMFSWGWDFGPRVPSIGIWRPVELVRTARASIRGHHVRVDAVDRTARTADLTIIVETETEAQVDEAALSVHVTLTAPSGQTHSATLPVTDGSARGRLHLDDAALWWTHDLGDPSLYDVRVELAEHGLVRDVVTDRVGLRTIALDRSAAPEGGRLFRFVLNGVPIFARGANWLPASMLVGSVSAQRHRDLVRLARDGGMTMLRVWGGGVYEQDSFYAATDEFGVLVWQDFMFACADYPSADQVLRHEVAREAAYQVRRLRNRASLALWCGNNEVQFVHGLAYQQYEPGNWGWDFFHRILPEAVERDDGTTPYWPGSPWGEDPSEGFMAVNGVLDGDRHAWEVWHGLDLGAGGGDDYATVAEARHYRRYARDRGRFISEFGIHAAPVRATLERWIPAAELNVHSPAFDAHNKDHPKDKGDALLEVITGLPTTLDEYIDFTMVSQAEGLKFGIEHYRRRQPHCNGALVWQLNDVWPGFSWSVIDYDAVPKAGYYACRRAYAPVVASFVHEDGVLALWVSNSGTSTVTTTAVVSVSTFDGDPCLEEHQAVTVCGGDSVLAWTHPVPESADRYAWVESTDGAFPANRLFLAAIKDLPLPDVALRWTVTPTSSTSVAVSIAADAFTYFVRVGAPSPTARFSDNYFELRPGSARTIQVTHLPEGFDPGLITVGSYVGASHSGPPAGGRR